MRYCLNILMIVLLFSCTTYNAKQLVAESEQMTREICVLKNIREKYNYVDHSYYLQYGGGAITFDTDFWITYTSPQQVLDIPRDLIDFKFDKYQDLYNQQRQLLKEIEYSGAICGIEVMPVDSIMKSSYMIRRLQSSDSLSLNREGKVDKLIRDLSIYKMWFENLSYGVPEEKNRYSGHYVEQFLIRYDGKRAIRIDFDRGKGPFLFVYKKERGKWVEDSKHSLPSIHIMPSGGF